MLSAVGKEFKQVFGNKKQLEVIDCQSSKDFARSVFELENIESCISNYESLTRYKDKLQELSN